MREVLVEKIQLVVAADHGGSAAVISQRPAVLGNGMDMQQLLGSLPVGGMPPFMQALVSSLTHLTTQVLDNMQLWMVTELTAGHLNSLNSWTHSDK
jgi:hypothetical protein